MRKIDGAIYNCNLLRELFLGGHNTVDKKRLKKLYKVTNGWMYITPGWLAVGEKKLERALPLTKILGFFWETYAMSPLIDTESAKSYIKYGLPSFGAHKGIGFTPKEYFALMAKMLVDNAGFTNNDLEEAEKIETVIDNLGIAPPGDTRIGDADIFPFSHTRTPDSDASYEERMNTPVMIGDALNILCYHVNNLNNYGELTLDTLFESVYYTLAKEGELSDEDIDRNMKAINDCKNNTAKVAKEARSKKKGKK